jgi:hypothetical protein
MLARPAKMPGFTGIYGALKKKKQKQRKNICK